jgi:hypothetical protein
MSTHARRGRTVCPPSRIEQRWLAGSRGWPIGGHWFLSRRRRHGLCLGTPLSKFLPPGAVFNNGVRVYAQNRRLRKAVMA